MRQTHLLLAALGTALFTNAEQVTVNNWTLDIANSSLESVVSGSGSLDLSGVEITNINPKAFAGNLDLTSITLPKTLESFNTVTKQYINDTFTGTADTNQGSRAGDPKTIAVSPEIPSHTSFEMIFEVKLNPAEGDSYDSCVGGWGSCLLATGNNPTATYYTNGFQLWLAPMVNQNNAHTNGVLKVKHSGATEHTISTDGLIETGSFTVRMNYDVVHSQGIFTVIDGKGNERVTTVNMPLNNINQLCYNVRPEVTETVTFQTVEWADPFAGTVNLESISIEEGNHLLSIQDSYVKNASGTILAAPVAPLYNRPVHLTFTETGNSLLANCVANSEGKIDVFAIRTCSSGPAAENPANSLFRIAFNNGKTMIGSINSSMNKGFAPNQHNDGAGCFGWLGTPDNNTLEITFAQSYISRTSIITMIAGGTDSPIYTINQGTAAAPKYLQPEGNPLAATPASIKIEPVTNIIVSSPTASTICLPLPVNVAAGGVIPVAVQDGKITTQKYSGLLPANTPLMLSTSDEPYSLPIVSEQTAANDDTATSLDASLLKGQCIQTSGITNYYLLSSNTFNLTTSGNIGAGTAYLQAPEGTTWDETLSLPSSVTLGIEEVAAPAPAALQGIYDLQGRRLSAPVKGLNIINGRKVMVK